MKQPMRWVLAGLLLGSFCAAPLGAEESGDDPTPAEVRERIDQLFESVAAADVPSIDEATCLEDLLQAQLRREEALSLVADAADPVLVEERTSAARGLVVGFVERLLDEGNEIESIDASRVALVDEGDEEGERLVAESGEDEIEITASGVVGVKMVSLAQEVDLGVYRLEDRWCLDPLSMQ